jgi:hypothetical protein
VKLAAGRPWNRTHKRPSKFWPVTVTTVPAGPEVGVIEVNRGGSGAACDTEAPTRPTTIAAPTMVDFTLERRRRPRGARLWVVVADVLVVLISTAFLIASGIPLRCLVLRLSSGRSLTSIPAFD